MNGGIQPTVELATNNGAYPVYPVMYGNNGYGNGGFFGGDGIWAIVLLALLFNNGGWGGFGGNGNNDFAWLSNGQKDIMTNTNNGFDTLHLSNQLEGNRDAINGISNQICNSTADVTSAVNNGFYNLNTSLLNCCCENRLASCQTQNTIVSEAAATRFADANNTRDIITSQTQGTQAILDKLCQLELDGVKAQVEAKNDRINDLQRELSMADLRASQTAQNAFIAQGLNNEVDALYNRLATCPINTIPVYGNQRIFTCPGNNGCGCGFNTTSQFI